MSHYMTLTHQKTNHTFVWEN